jgi:hypothetical protein
LYRGATEWAIIALLIYRMLQPKGAITKRRDARV